MNGDSEQAELLRLRKLAADRIEDLQRPRAFRYWSYFLLATGAAWSCAGALVFRPDLPLWTRVSLGCVGICAGYHAATFTHELAHIEPRRMRVFRATWHLLVGFPLAMPTFMYGPNHLVHHGRHYGTERDAEYIPRSGRRRGLLVFVGFNAIIALFGALRFLLGTPLTLLCPPLRRVVLERFSFMGMKLRFRRRLPADPSLRRGWLVQDCCTAATLWAFAIALLRGWLPWSFALVWYGGITGIGFLNAIRTLCGTHFYRSGGHLPVSWAQQQGDSIDILGRSPVTLLLFPVGTQYHLTHHLFPQIPFHALREARRRLEAVFPAGSCYVRNAWRSPWAAGRRVWGEALAGPSMGRRERVVEVEAPDAPAGVG